MSPCYSLELCIQMGLPFLFSFSFHVSGQEATCRTGHRTIDRFQIGKGVCQGYILSPCLFNLYEDYIMRSTSWNQDYQEKYQ